MGVSSLEAMASFIHNQAEERAAHSGGDAGIRSVNFKEDTTTIIRFVSEDVRVVKVHNFVNCRDGKKRTFLCPNVDDNNDYDEDGPCLICKNYTRKGRNDKIIRDYPSDRGLGLVALRETKSGKLNGKMTTITLDVPLPGTQTVTIDGETKDYEEVPYVGLVNMGLSSFWDSVINVFARYGTIIDRDFQITRTGTGFDTKYGVIALDKADAPDLDSAEKVAERYKVAVANHMSIDDYVKKMSSLDYQRKFAIIPLEEQINDEGAATKEASVKDTPVDPAPEESDDDVFAKLAERLGK